MKSLRHYHTTFVSVKCAGRKMLDRKESYDGVPFLLRPGFSLVPSPKTTHLDPIEKLKKTSVAGRVQIEEGIKKSSGAEKKEAKNKK